MPDEKNYFHAALTLLSMIPCTPNSSHSSQNLPFSSPHPYLEENHRLFIPSQKIASPLIFSLFVIPFQLLTFQPMIRQFAQKAYRFQLCFAYFTRTH